MEEDGSPFYLNTDSSREGLVGVTGGTASHNGAIPSHMPLFLHPASSGSSSAEYRGVIDDLTIENQTLRQKLKQYENMHCLPLQSDKLFEVRIHGLPAPKRRELKETLRKFAIETDEQVDGSSAAEGARGRYPSSKPSLMKAASSMTTAGGVTDSGYGSMAASLQASSNLLRNHRDFSYAANKARDQDIHSYLHDIPEGLLPRHAITMSESRRKKIVVRRLEQIFGGTQATTEGHQQPIQQQEVSQSAARADRCAIEANGQKAAVEGTREAIIMTSKTTDPSPARPVSSGDGVIRTLPEVENIGKNDFAFPAATRARLSPAPEQRPTRPLDLDPYRAQNPLENIEYIRNLGITFDNVGSTNEALQGQDWVYLNLVTNMAQLHTINVSTDFIKLAIGQYSQKLELSKDGRKVRWKGGQGVTIHSSDNSPVDELGYTGRANQARGLKRARPVQVERSSTVLSDSQPSKKLAASTRSVDRFRYTPLFAAVQKDTYKDISMADINSPAEVPLLGVTGGSATDAGQTPLSGTPKDGGPIVFYKNVRFCIDLSGDDSEQLQTKNGIDYQAFAPYPLGVAPSATVKWTDSLHSCAKPVRLARSIVSRGSSMAVPNVSESSDCTLKGFTFPTTSGKHVSFAEPAESVDLEMSGLGGIRPEDNMTITVMRQYLPAPSATLPRIKPDTHLKDLIAKRKVPVTAATENIVYERKTTLPPSSLPPASYAITPSEFEYASDEDSSNEDDEAAEPSPIVTQSMAQLARMPSDANIIRSHSLMSEDGPGSVYDSDGDMYDDNDEDDDDQSLDFLATARAADPAAIYAREREYDAELAERLAEEIPAGSSAATLGCGASGYSTPVSDEDDEGDDEDVMFESALVSGSCRS